MVNFYLKICVSVFNTRLDLISNLINFLTAFACVRETLMLFTCKRTSPGIGRVHDEPIPDFTSLIVHGYPDEK